MSRKKPQPKRQRQDNAEPNHPITNALKKAIDAQDKLAKARAQAAHAQEQRRTHIRAAFQAGADTKEISAALGISRAKIYQLIGSARALRA